MVASKNTIKKAQQERDGLHGRAKGKFKKIAGNLCYIGDCQCGGMLYSYLDDDPANIFNVYCLGECGHVSDIRFPRKVDKYFTDEENPSPIAMLQTLYKHNGVEIKDEAIKTLPESPLVGKDLGKDK